MKSKLINITYNKADTIKVTPEILQEVNFYQNYDDILENNPDLEKRNFYLNDLLWKIKTASIIKHIKDNSELQIDKDEFNEVLEALCYGNLDSYSNQELESFEKEAYDELYLAVIYDTFKQLLNVNITSKEVNHILGLDINKDKKVSKEAITNMYKALEIQKIEQGWETYFNINLDLNDKN